MKASIASPVVNWRRRKKRQAMQCAGTSEEEPRKKGSPHALSGPPPVNKRALGISPISTLKKKYGCALCVEILFSCCCVMHPTRKLFADLMPSLCLELSSLLAIHVSRKRYHDADHPPSTSRTCRRATLSAAFIVRDLLRLRMSDGRC